jgi:putative tryptophan/tyrosine transport system substrate-binding protein
LGGLFCSFSAGLIRYETVTLPGLRTYVDKAMASAIGLRVDVVQASDSREIESVFKTLVHNKANALLVGPDAFFVSRRLQLAILAARHAVPAVYNVREYAEAGGLMSYGTNSRDAYREIAAAECLFLGKAVVQRTSPQDRF